MLLILPRSPALSSTNSSRRPTKSSRRASLTWTPSMFCSTTWRTSIAVSSLPSAAMRVRYGATLPRHSSMPTSSPMLSTATSRLTTLPMGTRRLSRLLSARTSGPIWCASSRWPAPNSRTASLTANSSLLTPVPVTLLSSRPLSQPLTSPTFRPVVTAASTRASSRLPRSSSTQHPTTPSWPAVTCSLVSSRRLSMLLARQTL
mmetsp:Transcript_4546/g.9676  ORF Transcript_4546/g.9676 Transcript_4546/m.9676 type:complete len:203 (+) Transcript_4546:2443-3051(+)